MLHSSTARLTWPLVLLALLTPFASARQPNVVLVMTDDQGYGDLGCHGNEIIRTPNLDQLYTQSTRLTDFHVDPTCSPTRSALMTGRYSSRTGVWHTIMGRSMLHPDEVTIAELMRAAGYRTGIFGKWHLGDNYPLRPQDQGFDEVLVHGGGGVTQTPDYWGNDYFDDTYFRNGQPEKQEGYCTDVFFDAALEFIDKNRERPFFCYLPTNAPHGPFLVSDKYSQPYREAGVPNSRAAFWGMITNIDENMGRLLAKLDEWQLADDTILIFMTDNGTAAGDFNAGMRGKKGSAYEGGHRVPFFIRWPGRIAAGRDIDALTAHVDVLPTLAELCAFQLPPQVQIDGTSLAPALLAEKPVNKRTLFTHSQRIEHPQKWRQSAVMTDRWRLIDGQELYDMQSDPGQQADVAADHPETVENLRAEYEQWWESISTRFDDYVRIALGADEENLTTLTCHDWHSNQVPWHQGMVGRDPQANGFWAVVVSQPGTYRFTLRTRPAGIVQKLPAGTARVKVGEQQAVADIPADASQAVLELELPAGPARLQTWLGEERGAYFVEVERVK